MEYCIGLKSKCQLHALCGMLYLLTWINLTNNVKKKMQVTEDYSHLLHLKQEQN